MQHLSPEDLARLVDEDGDEQEGVHLQLCAECRAELDGLRQQSRALRALPLLAAPAAEWPALERRLREEGLLSAAAAPARSRRFPLARIAAAALLFVAGGASGAAAWATYTDGAAAAPVAAAETRTPEQAADALRAAETDYLAALARYAEMTGTSDAADPVNRLAALEGIVLTARAALREAPADPVINGYLLTALGQREAILRRISRDADETWF